MLDFARLLILSRSSPDVKIETGASLAAPQTVASRVRPWGNQSKRTIRNFVESFMLIWVGAADYHARHFLLLDRDGVLNEDRPDYIKHRDEFRFYEDALPALRWLHDHRIGAVLVSNQSGLNRGYITWENFWDIHTYLIEGVREAGGAILGAFYCPHRPEEGCSCRKPSPGLLRAASERFQIPLSETHFIGDRETDLLAASRAGCRGLLLDRVGYLSKSLQTNPDWRGVRTFTSLLEAVLTLAETWRS